MFTEEELNKMDRSELLLIVYEKGLTEFIPKNSPKSLIIDTILESQEEAYGQ